jgi:hypothetical protein
MERTCRLPVEPGRPRTWRGDCGRTRRLTAPLPGAARERAWGGGT